MHVFKVQSVWQTNYMMSGTEWKHKFSVRLQMRINERGWNSAGERVYGSYLWCIINCALCLRFNCMLCVGVCCWILLFQCHDSEQAVEVLLAFVHPFTFKSLPLKHWRNTFPEHFGSFNNVSLSACFYLLSLNDATMDTLARDVDLRLDKIKPWNLTWTY